MDKLTPEQEVERLYPDVPESVNRKQNATLNDLRYMQRSAHITAARMYMGEVEKYRKALEEIGKTNHDNHEKVIAKIKSIATEALK